MKPLFLAVAVGLVAGVGAQSGLWVDLASYRSPADTYLRTDSAMRTYAKNTDRLTQLQRDRMKAIGRYDSRMPFTVPATVRLSVGGRPLPPVRRAPGDLVLVFDSSGANAFPTAYRDLLQSVFDTAKATLNVVFGQPASGGNVLVKNYDADIGDRDAVAGGYFLPNNGSGQPEIRFPVYNSPESAAVNFLHVLLLAYIGPSPYGTDGFQEGLSRAATMKVARTAGALPGSLDPALVEATLDNTYDVGAFYDWYNQRALGGRQFIAPNLRDVPLPPGGSLGGIYLLRFQMAGSAWQKLLAENPGFIAEFNRRFYLQPGAANDLTQLAVIGQSALDTVKGTANATVEGVSFAAWLRRQFVLENRETLGRKLLVQPTPITTGLGGPDFGVFDVAATYFETQPGGNEVLLSGISYPIFWDQSFNRVFPSAQEDQMPISGAYGSVTPNLPDLNGGVPYRCVVDIPVTDRVARAYLPAGSIATAVNPTPNNFYGTVSGLNLSGGATARVRVMSGTTILAQPILRNGAFGALINNAAYNGYARLKVDVIRTLGGNDSIQMTRFVNKGPGELALDLRVNGDVTYTVPGGLLKGIQMFGLPVDPWVSSASDLLGLPDPEILIARYDPSLATYDLYPDTGPVVAGHGYFVRLDAAQPLQIQGRTHPGVGVVVACKPGWNMISCPINETVLTNRVQIIRTSESPATFTESIGVSLGAEFFEFQRGAVDSASGAPETGTMIPAARFEPGKMYFVRVLVAEGISLLFRPTTLTAKPGPPLPNSGWRIRASLAAGPNVTSSVFGQSTTGTRSLDRREDSGIPPRIGGVQIYVESTEPLYKDVRRMNVGETYRLRVDGLVKDRVYTVNFGQILGTAPPFVLRDPAWLVQRTLQAPASYTFRAKAASHRLEILVYGGGQ